jgi:hypothetical protein
MASAAPQVSPSRINEAGASGLRTAFSGQDLVLLLDAYMAGIKNVFAFAIAGAAASVFVALLIPWTRLPARDEKKVGEIDVVAM